MVWTRQESLWLLTRDSCSYAKEKPLSRSLRWHHCGSRILVFVIVHLMVTFATVIDLGAVMLIVGNGASVKVVE